MTNKLALVTGATGFVGRHLCPALDLAGYSLRALHVEPDPPRDWPVGIEWVKIDGIGPRTEWADALDGGVTHIVHLAAIAHRTAPNEQVSDDTYDEVNHQGTAQLVRAVAKTTSVKRLFFMSSIGAVTNGAEAPVCEDTFCRPDTAYGCSKLAAEKAVEITLAPTPIDWCIFRAPLLYGPGNPGNMDRLLRLLKLPLPLPFASVRNRRSFLFVGNLVSAILVALEHPAAARRVFCVSDGEELSTPKLLRYLAEASGKRVWLFPLPFWGLRLLGGLGSGVTRLTGKSLGFDLPAVEKLSASLSVDSTRFRQACGWSPPFSVEQGLEALMRAK